MNDVEGNVLTWDQTWMGVAHCIALRSHCVRQQMGAVVVDVSQRIVATGYNGEPRDYPSHAFKDCSDFCPRARPGAFHGQIEYTDCYAIHAEANALLFGDRREREGGCIYVTGVPCWDCARLIANSGLKRVVYFDDEATHRDPERSIKFLEDCKIEVMTWRT